MNTPYRWRLLVLAVTALLVSVVVFVGARVAERGEELAREAAMGIVARSIRATESTLNRHFLQVDSAVASLGPLLSQILDPDRPDDEKASRFLQELTTQSFVYRDLLVVRPDGAVWAAAVPLSRRRPLPLPVSAIASPANPGGAVIAGPVMAAVAVPAGEAPALAGPIALPIDNYYRTNPIARASETMGECEAQILAPLREAAE